MQGEARDEPNIRVTVPGPGGARDLFELAYVRGRGIEFKHLGAAPPLGTPVVSDGGVYDWVERCLRGDEQIVAFQAVSVWALVMVLLQLAALMLLTFEAPGPRDESNIIRYISDNIAVHQGYGGVMLVSFAGSYMLLSVVIFPAWLVYMSFVLVGGATFGGAGVVLFHPEHFSVQHIGSACAFIACGFLLHLLVIYSGPWRLRHTARDAVLVVLTSVTAVVFGGVLFANRLRIHASQDDAEPLTPRDPRLRVWLWTSGVCEYVLYLNMCALNALISQRVLEHTAWAVFSALPVCALRSRLRA